MDRKVSIAMLLFYEYLLNLKLINIILMEVLSSYGGRVTCHTLRRELNILSVEISSPLALKFSTYFCHKLDFINASSFVPCPPYIDENKVQTNASPERHIGLISC